MNIVIDLGVLITFTIGLTQALKMAFQSDTFNRFAPIVSLITATGLSFLQYGFEKEVVFYGIIVGLSASGLYSGTRSVAGMQ